MGQSYQDLIAWRRAMELVTEICRATKAFPRAELYGVNQPAEKSGGFRPRNIAEGQAHFSQKEFRHFLSHARGSLVEIETQLVIAQNLGYLHENDSRALFTKAGELGRILNGLIASIKSAAA